MQSYIEGRHSVSCCDAPTPRKLNCRVSHPPSPKHVALLLSLFHEALDGREDFLNAKTTFATAPSLIVLCELSSFFVDDPEATYEISNRICFVC